MSRLYHGTSRHFESFDPAHFGSLEERHANGNLGVWLALDEGLAKRFGNMGLDVELPYVVPDWLPHGAAVEPPLHLMTVEELHNLGLAMSAETSRADMATFFQDLRERYLTHDIQMLLIQESNGFVDMCICLAPETLAIVDRRPRDQVPDTFIPAPMRVPPTSAGHEVERSAETMIVNMTP